MRNLALTVDLVDDQEIIQSYIEHHRNVWPEVKNSLRAVGILDMRIWILGRRLFMLIDVEDDFDPATDFARYRTQDPKVEDWENLMEPMQIPVPEAEPGYKWTVMERIFQLSD